ncbi:MAG: EsaB/YukD family protein [Lachnospiraceae bacterium]|nr:EsaB/YukD family protein [Lachnospiraceae bacterium]
MIMIDVMIPALDRILDFEIDPGVAVKELEERIVRLTEEKEEVTFDPGSKMLFFMRTGDFLQPGLSMTEQGVGNGDRLILV